MFHSLVHPSLNLASLCPLSYLFLLDSFYWIAVQGRVGPLTREPTASFWLLEAPFFAPWDPLTPISSLTLPPFHHSAPTCESTLSFTHQSEISAALHSLPQSKGGGGSKREEINKREPRPLGVAIPFLFMDRKTKYLFLLFSRSEGEENMWNVLHLCPCPTFSSHQALRHCEGPFLCDVITMMMMYCCVCNDTTIVQVFRLWTGHRRLVAP